MPNKTETSKFTKKKSTITEYCKQKILNKKNCQIICSNQIVQQMVKFNKQNLPTIFDAVENSSATQSYSRNFQTVSVYITVQVKFPIFTQLNRIEI